MIASGKEWWSVPKWAAMLSSILCVGCAHQAPSMQSESPDQYYGMLVIGEADWGASSLREGDTLYEMRPDRVSRVIVQRTEEIVQNDREDGWQSGCTRWFAGPGLVLAILKHECHGGMTELQVGFYVMTPDSTWRAIRSDQPVLTSLDPPFRTER